MLLSIFILAILVGIVGKRFYDDGNGIIMSALGGFVFGGTSGLAIIFFIALFASGAIDAEYVAYKETEIYSLSNKSDIRGNFFLGIGTVDDIMRYYYLEEYGNGMRLRVEDARDVTIVETDGKPKKIYYKEVFKNKNITNYIPAFADGIRQEIYIPRGSVKYNFNIDISKE